LLNLVTAGADAAEVRSIRNDVRSVTKEGNCTMRRTEHLGARVLTAVGMLASALYLLWRVAFSLGDGPWWLSLPTLAAEGVGTLGAAALAWAMWPMPVAALQVVGPSEAGEVSAVDAVVRVDNHESHEVRATLLALRSAQHVNSTVLIDLSGRPEVAALATEFGALYAATDPDDRNGLRLALATVRTSEFLLLDAGDVPTGDIVARLAAALVDEHTALAQGLGVSYATDSAEHGPGGRHDLVFERAALNPALGRRGHAAWTGSGSLVRTVALREVTIDNRPAVAAQWTAGLALLGAGWRIVAPGEVPVVAHRAVLSPHEMTADREQRARAARSMVFGQRGVVRGRGFTSGQRLAVLAWAVRPLSAFRRVVFIALLCAALLAGQVPFHASALLLLCVWVPALLYTSLGLGLLSGWTLQPGDRTRWSLQTMWAAASSLRGATDSRRRHRSTVLATTHQGMGLAVAVVVLSTVLVLRGLSDRVTHTLGELPQPSMMALLVVSLWTLALALDLMRVLARRTQLRRTSRVVSSLAATFGERAVSIVDLTALGAGLVSQTGAERGERLLLESVVPTRTGVTTMRVPCVVRNVSALPDGDYRIGVEFGSLDTPTANALAEFCIIEPMWERMGALPGRSPSDARRLMYVTDPDGERPRARVALRVISLLALVGVVASSAPPGVSASSSLDHVLHGAVVEEIAGDPPFDPTVPDSLVEINEPVPTTEQVVVESAAGEPVGVPGVLVVGVCAIDIGVDGVWGTADDTYGTPAAVLTDADGVYELELYGEACWAIVAPPGEFVTDGGGGQLVPAADSAVPQVIDVSSGEAKQPTVVLQRVQASPVVPPPPPAPPGPPPGRSPEPNHLLQRLYERGLVPAAVVRAAGELPVAGPTDAEQRVLPTPSAAQVSAPTISRPTLSWLVLAVASLLAASILLGLARPRGAGAH